MINRWVICGWISIMAAAVMGQKLVFDVTYEPEVAPQAQTGRLLLLLSQDPSDEPRFQINDGLNTQLVFGRNVNDWEAGHKTSLDGSHPGFPISSLDQVPAGEYRVQAVLNRYHPFHLANGKVVWLPPDRGEGQRWNRKPGNLMSSVQTVTLTGKDQVVSLVLNQVMDPVAPPVETQYHRYLKIRSKKLSEFWGEDIYLAAWVQVPHGFDEHPQARYPLMVFHGHFPAQPSAFRVEPPDPDLEPDYSERFRIKGYNRLLQEESHANYQRWVSDDFPRFLVMEIQHPTPYYDDSYAVNSACQGPYGDAIVEELIPAVEKAFRGLGAGWARFLYGGSTGGWEAMAMQIFYPESFNGAFVACPDPIDFRAYMTVNIYEDANAYTYESAFKQVKRPGHRDCLGHVSASVEDFCRLEQVLGDRARSGGQFDIWEATYSPMAEDGYPKRLWNRETGVIDPQVAAYWLEHYDLRHILERDWAVLGPKLQGKLHIYVGDMDNYYLNNAVYLTETFLKATENPHYDGEVSYGDRAEHCWNGDPNLPNHITRLRYNTLYIPKIMKRIQATAPQGADLSSWRY